MKSEVGLWIDHRKAVIVTIENNTEMTRERRSNMEKHIRFSNGTQSKDSNNFHRSTAEDMQDRQFRNYLDRYYDGIISLIRDADSILIIGPGEAKLEFKNRLNRESLGERIVGIETVDIMTDQQIAAKVRDHYSKIGSPNPMPAIHSH